MNENPLGRRQLLVSPEIDRKGSTGKSGMVTESSNTTSLVVVEKLEIQEQALSGHETGQNVLPSRLAFVAVCKHDVSMLKRGVVVLWQLFETKNVGLLWCGPPRALFDNSTSQAESSETVLILKTLTSTR